MIDNLEYKSVNLTYKVKSATKIKRFFENAKKVTRKA
jgi:hypothetical protein